MFEFEEGSDARCKLQTSNMWEDIYLTSKENLINNFRRIKIDETGLCHSQIDSCKKTFTDMVQLKLNQNLQNHLKIAQAVDHAKSMTQINSIGAMGSIGSMNCNYPNLMSNINQPYSQNLLTHTSQEFQSNLNSNSNALADAIELDQLHTQNYSILPNSKRQRNELNNSIDSNNAWQLTKLKQNKVNHDDSYEASDNSSSGSDSDSDSDCSSSDSSCISRQTKSKPKLKTKFESLNSNSNSNSLKAQQQLLKKRKAYTYNKRNTKTRENYSSKITNVLNAWFEKHSEHPYPDMEQRTKLGEKTGLSAQQVNVYFVNYRTRLKKAKLAAEQLANQ